MRCRAVRRAGPIVDPIPFLVVFLDLLLVYLIVTPMPDPREIRINLPKARDLYQGLQVSPKWPALIVTLTRDGRLFAGTTQVWLEDIPRLVPQESLNTGLPVIRADEAVRMEKILGLLRVFRASGYERVVLRVGVKGT